jgi:hypothetical protein
VIAQLLPWLATGAVAVVMPPRFARLFRQLRAIEETETYQGKEKDWYLARH